MFRAGDETHMKFSVQSASLETNVLTLSVLCGFLHHEFSVSHLDVQVVVVSLSQLDEHGEQREDGSGAEEGALRPDHSHAEQSQDHRQQPVKPALQETLPVPLCITTHQTEDMTVRLKGTEAELTSNFFTKTFNTAFMTQLLQ